MVAVMVIWWQLFCRLCGSYGDYGVSYGGGGGGGGGSGGIDIDIETKQQELKVLFI